MNDKIIEFLQFLHSLSTDQLSLEQTVKIPAHSTPPPGATQPQNNTNQSDDDDDDDATEVICTTATILLSTSVIKPCFEGTAPRARAPSTTRTRSYLGVLGLNLFTPWLSSTRLQRVEVQICHVIMQVHDSTIFKTLCQKIITG